MTTACDTSPGLEKGDLVIELSPTQEAFVYSDYEVVMLKGSMGEGKTFCGVAALIAHAARCGRTIRGALVRDTHQNIKISTIPDIKEMLGDMVTFHDDYKKMVIHCTPRVEIDCFGIDDPASLSKLQGPQYAIIWLEEPAPIEEKANAGLPRAVFELAIARAARQTGTAMRVQITQNPADEDHWTEELANEPEVLAEDPMTGVQIRKAVFIIPYGENKHLNAHARAANIAAFQKDAGKFARYVKGVAAPVQKGKQVTPEYNKALHFSEVELPVMPGAMGLRGWDAWHNPVCIIGQHLAPGKIWIHDCVVGSGIGVKELIEQQVLPLLATPKYKGKIAEWRDMGDPTMRTPDQSSTQKITSKVLEKLLRTRFEPGPVRWQQRISPLKTGLTTICTDGSPQILVSKSAHIVNRALNGGWHFKVDNSGNIIGTMPVKDDSDHIGMAMTYIAACVFSVRAKKQEKFAEALKKVQQKKFANAYGPGVRVAGRL